MTAGKFLVVGSAKDSRLSEYCFLFEEISYYVRMLCGTVIGIHYFAFSYFKIPVVTAKPTKRV